MTVQCPVEGRVERFNCFYVISGNRNVDHFTLILSDNANKYDKVYGSISWGGESAANFMENTFATFSVTNRL